MMRSFGKGQPLILKFKTDMPTEKLREFLPECKFLMDSFYKRYWNDDPIQMELPESLNEHVKEYAYLGLGTDIIGAILDKARANLRSLKKRAENEKKQEERRLKRLLEKEQDPTKKKRKSAGKKKKEEKPKKPPKCPEVKNTSLLLTARQWSLRDGIFKITRKILKGEYNCKMYDYAKRNMTDVQGTCELKIIDNVVWCFLTYYKEKPKFEWNGTVIGVDLGLNKIAVTSDGRFFSNGYRRRVINKNRKRKAGLQKAQDKYGSQTAKKSLERHAHKVANFNKNQRFMLVKDLLGTVENPVYPPGTAIAFEDLTNILYTTKNKKSQNYEKHSFWGFAALQFAVEYKAKMMGLKVVYIDPRYTSKTCPKCGSVRPGNRGYGYKKGSDQKNWQLYHCQDCMSKGVYLHADFVGALNIAEKGYRMLERWQQRKAA